MIVFLDTGVLGLVASPNNTGEAKECKEWLYGLLAKSVYVVTSDICDYEVRRGLLLASLTNPTVQGIQNLDNLPAVIDFLPLTQMVMREAAHLWAQAHSQGIQTADNKNIDADIIICAQVRVIQQENPGQYIVVATTNTKHLQRFTEANVWRDVKF
ncbi:nuclease [Floridanema aerugineum]|uniref:Nuclease n=1 Tax=Floridaenema aerugineum BLCC-F46 TaxID=3153654 RepID=A0ABV4WYD9_9CYAN